MAALDVGHLVAVCTGLGSTQTDEDGRAYYELGEESIDNLRDLQRFLRRDSPETRDAFRQLGAFNIVRSDIIPILLQHGVEDFNLALEAIKVLVFLTFPPEPLSDDIAGQVAILQSFKAAFLDNGALAVICLMMAEPLAAHESGAMSPKQAQLSQLVLTLFRNLLAIPDPAPPIGSCAAGAHLAHMKDDLLERFFSENIMELMLSTATMADEEPFSKDALLLLEIFAAIYRGQRPEALVAATRARGVAGAKGQGQRGPMAGGGVDGSAGAAATKSAENQTSGDSRLKRLLQQEGLLPGGAPRGGSKKLQMDLLRHSRFGGTYLQTTACGTRALVKQNPLRTDREQRALNKGGEVRAVAPKRVAAEPVVVPSKRSVLELLDNFTTQFLESGGYGLLVQQAKDDILKEKAHVLESDSLNLLALTSFINGYCLEKQVLPYVVHRWAKAASDLDHKNVEQKSLLQLLCACLKNTMLVLKSTLDNAGADRADKHVARALVLTTLYDQDETGLLPALRTLLKNFDRFKLPRSYVVDLVELLDVTLSMLQELNDRWKETGFLVKLKKRRGKKHKKDAEKKDSASAKGKSEGELDGEEPKGDNDGIDGSGNGGKGGTAGPAGAGGSASATKTGEDDTFPPGRDTSQGGGRVRREDDDQVEGEKGNGDRDDGTGPGGVLGHDGAADNERGQAGPAEGRAAEPERLSSRNASHASPDSSVAPEKDPYDCAPPRPPKTAGERESRDAAGDARPSKDGVPGGSTAPHDGGDGTEAAGMAHGEESEEAGKGKGDGGGGESEYTAEGEVGEKGDGGQHAGADKAKGKEAGASGTKGGEAEKDGKKGVEGGMASDDEEEEDEEGEEEGEEGGVTERRFCMARAFAECATNHNVATYVWLLKGYRTNGDQLNGCVLRMLRDVVVDRCGLEPMLFQLSVLGVLGGILRDDVLAERSELKQFARAVVGSFFRHLKSQPLLFLDVLFWKTRQDCALIAADYALGEARKGRKGKGRPRALGARGKGDALGSDESEGGSDAERHGAEGDMPAAGDGGAVASRIFSEEEDELLRQLYDSHSRASRHHLPLILQDLNEQTEQRRAQGIDTGTAARDGRPFTYGQMVRRLHQLGLRSHRAKKGRVDPNAPAPRPLVDGLGDEGEGASDGGSGSEGGSGDEDSGDELAPPPMGSLSEEAIREAVKGLERPGKDDKSRDDDDDTDDGRDATDATAARMRATEPPLSGKQRDRLLSWLYREIQTASKLWGVAVTADADAADSEGERARVASRARLPAHVLVPLDAPLWQLTGTRRVKQLMFALGCQPPARADKGSADKGCVFWRLFPAVLDGGGADRAASGADWPTRALAVLGEHVSVADEELADGDDMGGTAKVADGGKRTAVPKGLSGHLRRLAKGGRAAAVASAAAERHALDKGAKGAGGKKGAEVEEEDAGDKQKGKGAGEAKGDGKGKEKGKGKGKGKKGDKKRRRSKYASSSDEEEEESDVEEDDEEGEGEGEEEGKGGEGKDKGEEEEDVPVFDVMNAKRVTGKRSQRTSNQPNKAPKRSSEEGAKNPSGNNRSKAKEGPGKGKDVPHANSDDEDGADDEEPLLPALARHGKTSQSAKGGAAKDKSGVAAPSAAKKGAPGGLNTSTDKTKAAAGRARLAKSAPAVPAQLSEEEKDEDDEVAGDDVDDIEDDAAPANANAGKTLAGRSAGRLARASVRKVGKQGAKAGIEDKIEEEEEVNEEVDVVLTGTTAKTREDKKRRSTEKRGSSDTSEIGEGDGDEGEAAPLPRASDHREKGPTGGPSAKPPITQGDAAVSALKKIASKLARVPFADVSGSEGNQGVDAGQRGKSGTGQAPAGGAGATGKGAGVASGVKEAPTERERDEDGNDGGGDGGAKKKRRLRRVAEDAPARAADAFVGVPMDDLEDAI
eukprot:jgi/Mesvir1/7392/Mv19193-RA.1